MENCKACNGIGSINGIQCVECEGFGQVSTPTVFSVDDYVKAHKLVLSWGKEANRRIHIIEQRHRLAKRLMEYRKLKREYKQW